MRRDKKKIRVLVVDDSSFMRKVISDILSADPFIEVVGTARDGEDGFEKFKKLSPDALTVDIEMPRKNGLELLEEIMKVRPVPIIVVSSLTHEGAEVTMKALNAGAVDFVTKPSGTISLDMDKVADELRQKVRMTCNINPKMIEPVGYNTICAKDKPLNISFPIAPSKIKPEPVLRRFPFQRPGLVVVAASTGGPRALQELLPAIKADFPVPILIVQHMPAGFTGPLATRLDELCRIRVVEGYDGLKIKKGVAVIAPGGYHMAVKQEKGELYCRLLDTPPVRSVKPAADVLFMSVAKEFSASTVVAVVLTGMGKDGTDGVRSLRETGAYVLAESKETCVIYGMPQSVVEAGLADEILPLDAIPGGLERLVLFSTVKDTGL